MGHSANSVVEGASSSIASTWQAAQQATQKQMRQASAASSKHANSAEQQMKVGSGVLDVESGSGQERNELKLRVFWGLGGETVLKFSAADAEMIVAAAETELAKGAADQKQEAIAGIFLLEVARTHFPLLCRFQCPGVTTWTELLNFFLEEDIDEDSSPKSLMCGWDKFRKLFLVVDSETQEELDTDEAISKLIVDAAEAAPTSSQLDDADRQRAADEGAEEQNEQTNAASSAVGARYRSATTESCTSRDVLIVQRVFDFKEVWETQDAMLAAFSIFAVPEEFCLAHKERKARARQWFLIEDDFEIPVLMDFAASRDPAAVEGLMRSTPLLLEYFIKERRCHNFFDWVRWYNCGRRGRKTLQEPPASKRCEFARILRFEGTFSPRSWSYQSVVEFFLDTSQEDLWDTGFERTWGNHFMLDDEMGLRCSYYTHLLEAAVRKCETNICGGADSGDSWRWPVGFDPFFAASRAVLDKVYYCRKTSFHSSGRFATVSTADIPAQDLQDEAAAQLHRCLCFEVLLLILLDFERQKRLPPSTPQSKCAALVIFMALRIGAQRAIERAAREDDAAKVKKFSAASARSSMMKLLSAGADANASPPDAICEELRNCNVQVGTRVELERSFTERGVAGGCLCELRPLPLAIVLGDEEMIAALCPPRSRAGQSAPYAVKQRLRATTTRGESRGARF